MGIYTDYGRHVKAREFRNYCNSEGGLWFAFSFGSYDWEKNPQNMPKAPPCGTRQLEDIKKEDEEEVTPPLKPEIIDTCPCGCGCLMFYNGEHKNNKYKTYPYTKTVEQVNDKEGVITYVSMYDHLFEIMTLRKYEAETTDTGDVVLGPFYKLNEEGKFVLLNVVDDEDVFVGQSNASTRILRLGVFPDNRAEGILTIGNIEGSRIKVDPLNDASFIEKSEGLDWDSIYCVSRTLNKIALETSITESPEEGTFNNEDEEGEGEEEEVEKQLSSEYSDIKARRFSNAFLEQNDGDGNITYSFINLPRTELETKRDYPLFPTSYESDISASESSEYVNRNLPLYTKKEDGVIKYYSDKDCTRIIIEPDKEKDPEGYRDFQLRKFRWVYSGSDNPFGYLGMVRGSAVLVQKSDKDALDSFYYGDTYWRLAKDDEYPTYVLLRVNINPNTFCTQYSIDCALKVQHIGVFHMKHEMKSSFYRAENSVFQTKHLTEEDVERIEGSGRNIIWQDNLEFLLNDYMIGSERVRNQIDRYGYVIGF